MEVCFFFAIVAQNIALLAYSCGFKLTSNATRLSRSMFTIANHVTDF